MPSGPTLEIPTTIGHNLRNVKYSCIAPFIQLYNDVMSIERKTGKGVTQLLIFMQVIYILHLLFYHIRDVVFHYDSTIFNALRIISYNNIRINIILLYPSPVEKYCS